MSYFFTQEIFWLQQETHSSHNCGNGEVNLYRPPLVMWAQCNCPDHIVSLTTDNVNSRQFLPLYPACVNPELLLFLSKEAEHYLDVMEVPLRGPLGPITATLCLFRQGVNVFWNVSSLIAEHGLHSCSRSSKEDGLPSRLMFQLMILCGLQMML